MPHHVPIIIISVSFGLALIATAIVLAGYFTNWFQATTTTSAQDPSTTDFPDMFRFDASGSSQQFTRTTPPSTNVQISDNIAYSADAILVQWTGTLNHISLVANTDDLAGNGDAYAWIYSVDDMSVIHYTTSNSTDILSANGVWTSTGSDTGVTVTITPLSN